MERFHPVFFRPWFVAVTTLAALAVASLAFAPASAGPVNLNAADAATLARELKGIGLTRAQAIVDYRAKHGPFKSVDELSLVKGIGKKAIEKNRADIRLDARAASGAASPAAATITPPAAKPKAR